MLKIIGGAHRGRVISSPGNAAIRPTGGLAKAALFNILTHGAPFAQGLSPLAGSMVADLFCGSGALGLEALSRGAAGVSFVDQSQEAMRLAATNAAHLGEEERCRFLRADCTRLPQASRQHSLALLDPPYGKNLIPLALTSLHLQGWLAPEAVICAEAGRREDITLPAPFASLDQRIYGQTQLLFLRYLPDA